MSLLPWPAPTPDPGRPRLLLCRTALDAASRQLDADLAGDRELRPALEELFACAQVDVDRAPEWRAPAQRALAATAGASGWPCLLLCLPDGRPFGASPWRPLRDRGRTPGLARVLLGAAGILAQHPEDCAADAGNLERLAAEEGGALRQGDPGDPALLSGAAEAAALAVADPLEGGFGPPPRHPAHALLAFCAARAAREDASLALQRQVELTCGALVAGALHDHLAGGFFAACEDARWEQPRCEKRARDQAQLALLLLDHGGPLQRVVAERALAWTATALQRPDGLVAHGLAADPACYRWSEAQAADLLGSEGARLVAERFALPAGEPGFPVLRDPRPHPRLAELVARLAAARCERPQPERDATAFAADQGQLLCAWSRLPAMRDRAEALWLRCDQDQPPAWWEADGRPGPRPAGARALAWLARGACALGRLERAAVWAARAAALADDPLDDEDGPSAAACAALACCEMHRAGVAGSWRSEAERLLASWPGLLHRVPLAGAGLLLARERWEQVR